MINFIMNMQRMIVHVEKSARDIERYDEKHYSKGNQSHYSILCSHAHNSAQSIKCR